MQKSITRSVQNKSISSSLRHFVIEMVRVKVALGKLEESGTRISPVFQRSDYSQIGLIEKLIQSC